MNSNDNNSSMTATELPGGTLRVSVGPIVSSIPASGPAFDSGRPSTYVHQGALSHTAGGEVVQRGYASHQVSHEGATGGSVLATLQKSGPNTSVELIPGVPSSRTHVASALRDGLLVRDAAGQLQDAPVASATLARQQQQAEAPQQQQQEQQQAATDPGEGVFDAGDDEAWNADISPLPQSAYDAAVAGIVGHIATGAISLDSVAKSLSANAGIEPALAADYVKQGTTMYTNVVARAVAPLGLTGDSLQAFFDSTKSQPGKLQDSLQRLIHERDPAGFVALAQAYTQANPGAGIAALKAAGFEIARDPTGGPVARLGSGEWVPVSQLMKG